MEALLQDKNLKRICVLIILSLWVWSVVGESTLPGDSLGLKSMDGKSFIIYQMSKSETAYAVSRKYNVPFREIAAANPGIDMNALKEGQQILVPVLITTTTQTITPVEKEEVKEEEIKGEGLKGEGLKGEGLKEEGLKGEGLKEEGLKGEGLKGEGLKEEGLKGEGLKEEGLKEEIREPETQGNSRSFAMIYADYQSTGMIAAFEKGVATWIENNGIETSGDRFYALHSTAPIGSVVKVRNMMNNRIIYAKVIGKLSESEMNAKVLIKLSAGAGERLNVLDNRFVVEITYYMTDEVKATD